jgi:HEAT repeat protein
MFMEDCMSTIRSIVPNFAKRVLSNLVVWCVLPAGVAHSLVAQSQSNKDADAIAKVKSGDFGVLEVDQVARAGAAQVIPNLEDRFAHTEDARTDDALMKGKIAVALVRLGDKDDTYWNYLATRAAAAIESDAPFQGSVDPQGNWHQSPEFTAWAKAHYGSPSEASEDARVWLPGRVLMLGQTDDPRAIPLLRRALWSPNYLIEAAGVMGLAELQDKDSIPLIIQAVQRAPAEAATAVALWLPYFDDPRAQSAADTYLPKDLVTATRETIRIHGNKPMNSAGIP